MFHVKYKFVSKHFLRVIPSGDIYYIVKILCGMVELFFPSPGPNMYNVPVSS